MAESLKIANAALTHLGSVLIGSLSELTRQAQHVNDRIEPVRQAVLRSHPWAWATVRARLTSTYKTITGASDNGSGLIRITATSHGFVTGDTIRIDEVEGTTEANGTWIVTKIDANTFDLDDSEFINTYTAEGRAIEIPPFGWSYRHTVPSTSLRILMVEFDDCKIEYELEGGFILSNHETIDVRYIDDIEDDTVFDALFKQAFALMLAWEICIVITQSDAQREQLLKEYRAILARARYVDSTEKSAEQLEADDVIDAHLMGRNDFVRDPMT